jgi:dethiobiotin synthetase
VTGLFITGTGTDIGKTFVTAGLVRFLRTRGLEARALKPVASGFDPRTADESDPGILLAAMGQPITESEIARITGFRFSAPLAPDMAARREDRRLTCADIVAFCRVALAEPGPLLVEGVGGLMSPCAEDATCLDLIAALDLPVLLVAGSYLGAISHTLTAMTVLRQPGTDLRAVVVNETPGSSVPLDETRAAIARFSQRAHPGSDTLVVSLPRGAGPPDMARLAALCGLAA